MARVKFPTLLSIFFLAALFFGSCDSGGGGGGTNPHVFRTGSIAVSNDEGHVVFSNLFGTGQLLFSDAHLFPERNTYLRFETALGMVLDVPGGGSTVFGGHLVGRVGVTGDALTVVSGNNLWVYAEALSTFRLSLSNPDSVRWSVRDNLFVDFSTSQDLAVDTGKRSLLLQAPVFGQVSATGRAAVFEDAAGVALFTNNSWPLYAAASDLDYQVMPNPHTFMALSAHGDLDFSGELTVPGPSYGEVSASGDHMAFDSDGDLYLFSRSLPFWGLLMEGSNYTFPNGGNTFLRFTSNEWVTYDSGVNTVTFWPPMEGRASGDGACIAIADSLGLGIFTPFLPTSVFLIDEADVQFEYNSMAYVWFHSIQGLSIQGEVLDDFEITDEVWGRAAETGEMVTASTYWNAFLFSRAFPGYYAYLDRPYSITYHPDAATFLYFETDEDMVIPDYGEIDGPCEGWVSRSGDFVAVLNDDGLWFFGRQLEGANIEWVDLELWIYPDQDHLLRAEGWENQQPFGDAPFVVRVLR